MIRRLLNLHNAKPNGATLNEEVIQLREENQKLQVQNKMLVEESQTLKTTILEKNAIIHALTGKLRKLLKEMFDKSSEKSQYMDPNAKEEAGADTENHDDARPEEDSPSPHHQLDHPTRHPTAMIAMKITPKRHVKKALMEGLFQKTYLK